MTKFQILKSQSIQQALLLVLLSAGSIYFFHDRIHLFPSFIHAWTQSDRYALALGFLNNGFDFFHPQTFNLLTVDGITRVDFPVHEYIVALLMKVSGTTSPAVFRIYTLLYAITGLLFLFRLCGLYTSSFVKKIFVPLFIFFCPVYLYYADGFLPSVPSLSNLFIGYYFYFRFKKTSSRRDFNFSIFFLTVAALARMPFFIFLFAVFCQEMVGYVRKKNFRKSELVVFGISFLVFGSYQLYNSWLGKKYGTQFLVSPLPPKGWHDLKNWALETWMNWRYDYISIPQHLLLTAGMIWIAFLLIRKKFIPGREELILQWAIALCGALLFNFLSLKQFPDHDYYFIDTYYPLLGLLLVALASIDVKTKYGSAILITGMIVCLFFSFAEAKKNLEKRYVWNHWDRTEWSRRNFTGVEKFLDSLGVSKSAKVLVLDGYTTNTPLILMNRKGWTVNWTSRDRIAEGLLKPFDIAVIQNAFLPSDVLRNYPYLTSSLEKFADNGYVSFFKRAKKPQPVNQIFGIDESNTIHSSEKSGLTAFNPAYEFNDLFSDTAFRFTESIRPVKILVSGDIFFDSIAPRLISSLSNADQTYYYFLFDLNEYSQPGTWQPLLFQFVIPPVESLAVLKTYFWNSAKSPFKVRNLKVTVYK